MSCYHPLPAYKDFSGQVRVLKHGQTIDSVFQDQFKVPCGKCIGCRLDYSRTWADRCVLESLDYPKELCWFLTLTYDENHIETEKRSLVSEKGTLTLYPKDVQDFMKRLRRHWEYKYKAQNIRFFLCGEYGSTTARPHYHLLLYGLPIFDLKEYGKNGKGDCHYGSEEIADLWGHGFIVLGSLTWETAAYTARYVLKKFKGESKEETEKHYKEAGILPEFTRCSRKPGIAANYFYKNFEKIYKNDEIILPLGKVTKPPKFFDNLLKGCDFELHEATVSNRKHIAELKQAIVFKQHGYTEEQYFQIQEENKKNQVKALTRYL